MKKYKPILKLTLIIILIVAVLGLAVYGLISLIKNLTGEKNHVNPDSDTVESFMPTGSPSRDDDSDDKLPSYTENELELEINVTPNQDNIVITNPGENYTFTNKTGDNKLLIFIKDRISEEYGYTDAGVSEIIKGYSISEEPGGILITVNINTPFTIIENKDHDSVSFNIISQKNQGVMEYRNDLSRLYLNIDKARLSSESDSFIKNYSQTFDEEELLYTISIKKNLMPKLNDEILVFNDGMIKSIEVINDSSEIKLKVKVYEEIIIYPNTRDYDAAFTFIKPKDDENPLIVLDPGHGGIDGGTTSADGSILEKDIVLNMCDKITGYLQESGFSVINLREEDIFLGLMERTDIANLAMADAIISVHVNSYSAEYVNGTTTLYKTSDGLAKAIQSAVIQKTGANDMGIVKMNDLSILNRAEMDAVIVETGFISNEDEAQLLNDPDYQDKVAKGIADGIETYFKGE